MTTTNRVSMRAMPQLHEPDASCDMGGDTSPGVFGHTVIAVLPAGRPRAPAPAARKWEPSDTLVVNVDVAPSIRTILRYLAYSHQAFSDQVTILQLLRRCAVEIEQDGEAIEALGELAAQHDLDRRGPFVRAFDESALAFPIPDGDGANGEAIFTTWEILALDQVIQVLTILDRFRDALTEGA